jgi:hypothetical protein
MAAQDPHFVLTQSMNALHNRDVVRCFTKTLNSSQRKRNS